MVGDMHSPIFDESKIVQQSTAASQVVFVLGAVAVRVCRSVVLSYRVRSASHHRCFGLQDSQLGIVKVVINFVNL